DQVANLSKTCSSEQRRVLRQELRIVRLRSVHVRAREDDELRHVELCDVFEQLLEACHVPGVMLCLRRTRVVHHAQMNDPFDGLRAEDVLQLLPPNVHLLVSHVLGLVRKGTSIDTDDGALTMKHADDLLAEAATCARDEDRSLAS